MYVLIQKFSLKRSRTLTKCFSATNGNAVLSVGISRRVLYRVYFPVYLHVPVYTFIHLQSKIYTKNAFMQSIYRVSDKNIYKV